MCVDGLGYVYVCECYAVLDESWFVLPVCAYGGVMRYFRCFRCMCEFCFLYCDDVLLRVVYEVFSSSNLFLMPFMLI